jgi:hypothetical protein
VTTELAAQYRVAPRGFSEEEWDLFQRDGFLELEERLGDAEVERYLEAVRECIEDGPKYDPAKTYKISRVVEKHPAFTELIAHERHVGYPYDIYGDQLMLIQSELFYRPPGSFVNEWHIDGPRVVPYRVFSRELPLKIRVGYWLTDLPRPGMGNFVFVPGSHRSDYAHEHWGREPLPGQRVFTCERGTIAIMSGDLWHRVEANESDAVRQNVFVSYAPSWVHGYYDPDPAWLETLEREQRIIMRPYRDSQKYYSRPPAEDLPLFLDRETLSDEDDWIDPSVERQKRRRLTMHEKLRARREAQRA